METTFHAIGIEVPSQKDFNHLAERAGDQGEPTELPRRGAVLHGRCWKLGGGLEVWTVLYESDSGKIFYADCRPGFRARYTQRVTPWALTEYDEEGEAVVHGYIDGSDTEILFELQNLTEVGAEGFKLSELQVGLCGLAYRAHISRRGAPCSWQPVQQRRMAIDARENDWYLCGRVIEIKPLRNPLSGTELYWTYLDLERFKLEVLVNSHALRGKRLSVNSMMTAEVWLQGHLHNRRSLLSCYEGVDHSYPRSACWSMLKRSN